MKTPKIGANFIAIFKNKRVRYGGYAALITLAAAVLLITVNLIFQLAPVEIDMTENRLFSLSDQTVELINTLEDDVVIYALYTPGRESPNVVDVLNKYVRASDHIRLEYIDPEKNPLFLRKFASEEMSLGNGTLIFESGEISKIIPSIDLYDVSYSQSGEARVMGFKAEQRFTNALLYVTSGVTPKIYVIEGHGEYSLQQLGLLQTVEKENFLVEKLNLLTTPEVPADADMVLLLSPELDLAEREALALISYLENDGSALFFFDFNDADLTRYNEVLGGFGVEIETGIVMESDRSYLYTPDNLLFIAPMLIEHAITGPLLANKLTVLMPTNLPVKILDIRKRNVEIEPLLQTSPNSWIRTDLENSSMFKQAGDIPGPVSLAVAISKKKSEMNEPEGYRIVVAGNASFIGSISYFGNLKPNIDFFMNSLSWLNKRTDSISVRSKSLFEFPLRMSGTLQLMYAGILALLIPIGILIAGLVVWLRRRHL